MANFLNLSEYLKNFKAPSLSNLSLKEASKIDLSTSDVLKITSGALAGFSVLYCCKIWRDYSFFKKREIETPDYKFFFGNTTELYGKQYSIALREWTKKFGKVYGYYEGHFPMLVTSDVKIINEVFVKQFNNFSARKMAPFQHLDNPSDGHLVDSSATKWKRMRNVINPTFTPAKLKELVPLMNKVTQRLLQLIELNADKEINSSDFFNAYTMDNISNCAFGIDADCQGRAEGQMFKNAKRLFRTANEFNLFLALPLFFHEFRFVIIPMTNIISNILDKFVNNLGLPIYWLKNNISKILEKRIADKIYKKDYLQLLIDAQSDEFDHSNDSMQYDYKTVNLQKKLTFDEVKSNTIAFLLAGYETTATTLGYCMYVLATHPEELKKLQDEIDSSFGQKTEEPVELNYESVNHLEYLDLFIKEVLRMYPIGNNVCTRRCTNPTKIEGIEFEKGMVIAVDVLTLHYSKENWGPEDPENFYPLRHSPENKRNPACYLAFGYGPRSCVGQRFALLELKLALTEILSKFDVVKSSKTPEVMTYNERLSVRQPKDGVSCIFKHRVL